MQLGRRRVGIAIVHVVDRCEHIFAQVIEEVASERHAEMTEVEAHSGADGAQRRGKLVQRTMLEPEGERVQLARDGGGRAETAARERARERPGEDAAGLAYVFARF